MQIRFKLFGRNYNLSIGYDTAHFKQMYFITFIEEWYDSQGEVVNAYMVFKCFKHKKYN
jgi:hypothetical protein